MRAGVRIGVDVGKARIGIARSDPHGLLATPVETIPRSPNGHADVQRIREIVQEHDAVECIVGYPLNMRGEHTPSTEDAVSIAQQLCNSGVEVRLVDERLSTVTAWDHLHATGKNHKAGRGIIDQAAAVVILQHALDTERNSGQPAGTPVSRDRDEDLTR